MKKPTRWSRYSMLKRSYQRNHKWPKPLYLYRFPEHRLRGWLCAGNGTGWQANH